MPIHIEWSAIALRLALCALASAVIGINRGEADRPVGLRTTMLVSLAATIAMIQVNLLLPIAGKTGDSFAVMDLMRLPLGILSGMGFIGAGAIVRRGNLVQGVTTAATLWFATVMGLCFGGGQIYLGLTALVLAILVLWPLKWLEHSLGRERRAELSITVEAASAADEKVLSRLVSTGFRVHERTIAFGEHGEHRALRCDVCWFEGHPSATPADLARELAGQSDVIAFEWRQLRGQ